MSTSLVEKEVVIVGSGARARVSECISDDWLKLAPGSEIGEVRRDGVLVLPIAPSSMQYLTAHNIDFNTRVGDGFVDPGRHALSAAPLVPEDLARLPAGEFGEREVLVVDTRIDASLRECIERARSVVRPITVKRDRIKALGAHVSGLLGGLPDDADIGERSGRHIRALMQARRSMLVPLGQISHGVCRHRALLFKVLCDALGIECALVRGDIHGETGAGGPAGGHTWNVVHVNGSALIVDVMLRPGELYAEGACDHYLRLAERSGGGGGAQHHGAGLNSLPAPAPREPWHVRPVDVEIERGADGAEAELGSGGFGRVFAARLRGAQPVAVKRLNAAGANARLEFEGEVEMLRGLRNAHIVLFYGACVEPENLMIITERMRGGSLHDALAGAPARVAWAAAGARIALHVAYALHYLHTLEPPVVHYDVKPANVLLNEDYSLAKLADVGLARTMAHSLQTVPGCTLAYAAPEVMDRRATEKADVYSFGRLVDDLLTRAQSPRPPAEPPADVLELKLRCVQWEPALRPSAADLVWALERHWLDDERAVDAAPPVEQPPAPSWPEPPPAAPGRPAATGPGEAELAAMSWPELCAALYLTASDPAGAECALRAAANRTGPGEDGDVARRDAADAGALGAVVAAMGAHAASAGVQSHACAALRNICTGTNARGLSRKQQAVDAGALGAVVRAMDAHTASAAVQEQACTTLVTICAGADAAACERAQHAAAVGALGAVVRAMRAHSTHAVHEQACTALAALCAGDSAASRARTQGAVARVQQAAERAQQAAEAGALGAVVAAMRAHVARAGVQTQACRALRNICAGTDAAGRSRAQQAAEAGALGAVVGAMGAHAASATVQEQACRALRNLCLRTDEAGPARAQHAAAAGALGAAVVAMRKLKESTAVQEQACLVLATICAGDGEAAQQAADAGALGAAVSAMRKHKAEAGVQEQACFVLATLCDFYDAAGRERAQRAADSGALGAVVAAMRAHDKNAGVQEYGCWAMDSICAGTDAAGSARWQQAAKSGAPAALKAAQKKHGTSRPQLQERTASMLTQLSNLSLSSGSVS